MRYVSIILTLLANTAWASSLTIGSFGIDSKSTGLDGTGIEIGEVDITRSAKADYDDPENSASNTIPSQVYYRTGTVQPNDRIDVHATTVAGVMIGKTNAGAIYEGVAPNANLHSAAFGGGATDADAAITLN